MERGPGRAETMDKKKRGTDGWARRTPPLCPKKKGNLKLDVGERTRQFCVAERRGEASHTGRKKMDADGKTVGSSAPQMGEKRRPNVATERESIINEQKGGDENRKKGQHDDP